MLPATAYSEGWSLAPVRESNACVLVIPCLAGLFVCYSISGVDVDIAWCRAFVEKCRCPLPSPCLLSRFLHTQRPNCFICLLTSAFRLSKLSSG